MVECIIENMRYNLRMCERTRHTRLNRLGHARGQQPQCPAALSYFTLKVQAIGYQSLPCHGRFTDTKADGK